MHPLEQLALDVADGRTSLDSGERTAAALAASGAVTGQDLICWFKTAEWLAHREGLWERALLLGRLLTAAVEALPASTSPYDRVRCRSAWTELVHLCVIHRPDGALFASGVRAGHAALAAARGLSDDLAGQVLYRLGTLHLDPFSRAKDLWWEEHRLWLSLCPQAALAGLPEPHEALKTAEGHLREAATLRSGAGLGYTCKALAQALQQQEFLALTTTADAASSTSAATSLGSQGAALDSVATLDSVTALCDQALALIPVEDLVARASVEAIRSGAGPAAPGVSPA
ncbi:hypothetical protein [Sphaerimonospora mesophila]|uniref:hypothetical protein n=1 Tax=Sphaerimonospora mesophila TaxID=37483 RepID=UPI0006E2F049